MTPLWCSGGGSTQERRKPVDEIEVSMTFAGAEDGAKRNEQIVDLDNGLAGYTIELKIFAPWTKILPNPVTLALLKYLAE